MLKKGSPVKLIIAILSLVGCSFELCAQDTIQLKTASGHPMQYYLSLPKGWSAQKKWPIMVAVEEAAKQFKENAARFSKARGEMPFIIVSPCIVTNGRQGQRDPEIYPYTVETWDRIEREGVCTFDTTGLLHVIGDVQKTYSGEDRFFITGFEAGADLVWAMAFAHPEKLRAAAPVAGNYIGRCVDPAGISTDKSRSTLPIKGFVGLADSLCMPGGKIYYQWENAVKLAKESGFQNISESRIGDRGHVPMPKEVLAFFFDVWKQGDSRSGGK